MRISLFIDKYGTAGAVAIVAPAVRASAAAAAALAIG
jgi:hypothetical protein